MLRTNLSTRPFYNERVVRVILGLVAAVAAALTSYNVSEIVRLRSRDAEVRRQSEAAEREADRLQGEARRIRQTINRDQLAAVQVAAHEANRLIDRRTFSWTELLNQFEQTLPPEVRIAAVTPQVDPAGRMIVADDGVLAAHRGSRQIHGRAREDRRIPECAVTAGRSAGGRHVEVRHPGLLHRQAVAA